MPDASANLYIDVIYRDAEKGLQNIQKDFETSSKNVAKNLAGSDLTDQFNVLRKEAQTLGRIGDSIGTNNDIYVQQAERVREIGNQLNLTANDMANLQRRTAAFNFDFLTFIFAGMMIQRTFGTALRSLIDSYKKITGMNSEFTRAVLKLSASWGYLKFAIANALNSPMIINAIEWIIDRMEALANWFADNQDLALGLVGALAGIYALGKMSSLIGGFLQLGMMIRALTPIISGAFAGSFLTFFAIAIAVILVLYLAWKENFAGMQQIAEDTVQAVKDAFGRLVPDVGNFFSALGEILSGIFNADMNKIIDGVVKLSIAVGNILTSIVGVAIQLSVLAAALITNAVEAIVELAVQAILKLVEGAAYLMDSVLGTNLQAKIKSAENWVSDFGKSFRDTMIKNAQDVNAGIGDMMDSIISSQNKLVEKTSTEVKIPMSSNDVDMTKDRYNALLDSMTNRQQVLSNQTQQWNDLADAMKNADSYLASLEQRQQNFNINATTNSTFKTFSTTTQ